MELKDKQGAGSIDGNGMLGFIVDKVNTLS